MSISDDVKAYADSAVEQGKRVIDQAQQALADRRSLDPKSLADNARRDLDMFLSAVEPYVAQARGLRDALVERTEGFVGDVRKDPRVSRAYDTAESFATTVVETVNDKIVSPALSLAGRKPSGSTRPRQSHPEPAKKATKAAKSTAQKTTRKASTAAKTTARKATASKTTAKKAAPRKTAAKKAN